MGEEEKRPYSGTAAPGITRTTILYALVAIVVVILGIAVAVQMNLFTSLPVPASGSASIGRPIAAAASTIGPAIARTTMIVPPELRCPAGLTRCGSGCIDTRSDIFNCGSCGKVCPAVAGAERTCAGSTCGFVCTHSFGETFSDCNKIAADGCEVNLASDRNNCGECGDACDEGDVCLMGACKEPLTGGGGGKPLTQSAADQVLP